MNHQFEENPYLMFRLQRKLAEKERYYIKQIEYYQRKIDKYNEKYQLLTGSPYKSGNYKYDIFFKETNPTLKDKSEPKKPKTP